MTLHDALIKAMKKCKSDEERSEAVLGLLGLDADDCIISMEHLAWLVAHAQDASATLATYSGEWAPIEGATGDIWDEDDMKKMHKVIESSLALLSSEYVE